MGRIWEKFVTLGYLLLVTQDAVGGNAWYDATSREDMEQRSNLYQNPKKIKPLKIPPDFTPIVCLRETLWFFYIVYTKNTPLSSILCEWVTHIHITLRVPWDLVFGKMMVKISTYWTFLCLLPFDWYLTQTVEMIQSV